MIRAGRFLPPEIDEDTAQTVSQRVSRLASRLAFN